MHNYKELDIWKKSMKLCEDVYKIINEFPKDERFGLVSQTKRSALSVPSNIAEGAGRNTKGEFSQFLGISTGSLFELETQLILSKKLIRIESQEIDICLKNIEELKKMIYGLQKSLK